jgi:hypothetical protein
MQVVDAVKSVHEVLQSYFTNQTKPVQKQLPHWISCMALCGKFNTQEMVRKACEINHKCFSTNENNLLSLLNSDNLQIDDQMFRNYLNFIFDFFREQGLQNNALLQINVDCTTIRDKFLILQASIIYNNTNYPLYFSLRITPGKGCNFDHKLLEAAFIKAIKHGLSKKYRYRIVADRGFGNLRILELCEKSNFEFCIRLNQNLNIILEDGREVNLEDFSGQNIEFFARVKKWGKELKFIVSTKNGKTWFLVTNSKDVYSAAYEQRWGIEILFKHMKSLGFDIEKTKIKNYSHMKKMLFMLFFAYAIYLNIGILSAPNKTFKKKSKNHASIFCLFSLPANMPS